MKMISRTATFNAPAEKVFSCLDDLGVTGMHMTSSSAMMMGNNLQLQFLTRHHTGPGTKYRWTGSMMGLKMDFSVEVTKWIEGVEKVWETIGEARMIIDEHFRIIDLLISDLNKKYSAVSRLFSEVEVIAIEQFFNLQKIKKLRNCSYMQNIILMKFHTSFDTAMLRIYPHNLKRSLA